MKLKLPKNWAGAIVLWGMIAALGWNYWWTFSNTLTIAKIKGAIEGANEAHDKMEKLLNKIIK